MRLATAEVDRYGPLVDCRPPCRDGLTVLSGPNEAGKTLYLEALLRLLDPTVEDVMDPSPRVDAAPSGRVVVEHAGDTFECDGDSTLSDGTAIEPAHLQSVFVVRDNDLHLPSDQQYYTSLIEKLGDIHTTEIAAVEDGLKATGRLTDSRLNISSDQAFDNAGDVRDTAESLAAAIREYVQEIDAENLDELDAERLRTTRRLRETRERLQTQRAAERAATYDRLSARLETYRETSEQLSALSAYDRETLDELRRLQRDVERDRAELADLEDDIEEQRAAVQRTHDSVANLRQRAAELEARESAVADARAALETYRDRQDDVAGLDRRLALTRTTTAAAVGAAGIAGAAGALAGSTLAVALGGVLLLVAVLSGLGYLRSSRRLDAVETTRKSVLRAARDAGLSVESPADVAGEIEAFATELAGITERRTRTEQDHQNAKGTLEALRDEKSELEARVADRESDLAERLEAAGAETLDAYADHVDTVDDLETERLEARRSLVDRFGEQAAGDPDAVDPEEADPAAAADEWQSALEDVVADLDLDAVDPEAYDEAELENLEAAVADLEARVEELDERLRAHDARLDEFHERARDLTTRPFVGHGLELPARSRDGLQSLAEDLDEVVDRLERDAEVSRKALDVFADIEAREQQKLETLFASDGPASTVFERVTDGRYSEVAYDADEHALVVERRDGRTFDSTRLSQATTDQLYFATRVSLAEQLLGSDPGFLLLDDPFLAADTDRLHRGFETLERLADDGWQVVYLTAKDEVSNGMVDEFDLHHVELETVTFGT